MSKRVLVVDDHPAVALALEVAFRVGGRFVLAIVSVAAAGQAASHGRGMRAQAAAFSGVMARASPRDGRGTVAIRVWHGDGRPWRGRQCRPRNAGQATRPRRFVLRARLVAPGDRAAEVRRLFCCR
jgi:hypothetical protein